jgi:hypothetical protein
MAPTLDRTIALFDVDGTLTVPRKVRKEWGGGGTVRRPSSPRCGGRANDSARPDL